MVSVYQKLNSGAGTVKVRLAGTRLMSEGASGPAAPLERPPREPPGTLLGAGAVWYPRPPSAVPVPGGARGMPAATPNAPLSVADIRVPAATLDAILAAQLVVAWAGEGGEAPRLKWWKTDLASEFGGEDLFRRLLPHTWQWAVLEAVREAARRRDAELRAQDHDPDRLITLFRLGFEVDERLDERLADLKRAATPPQTALPGLKEVTGAPWSKELFSNWAAGHGEAAWVAAPVGRRLKGDPPASVELLVKKLVAALHPLADAYPMPHYRRADG